MNTINKVKLNQEINTNYDKLMYINEIYEDVQSKYIIEKEKIQNNQSGNNRINNRMIDQLLLYSLLLPINELDNTKVNIFIKFNYSYIKLEICAHGIIRCMNNLKYNNIILASTDNLRLKLDFQYYIIAFIKIEHILKNYKFNNTIGSFQNKKSKCFSMIFTKMLSTENIKLNIQECCVCFELTEITTMCNHTLCYKCWENIKGSRYDKKCPICRQLLNTDTDEDYLENEDEDYL